jgi:branched-chain amino acid transport system permease protein
MRTGHYKESIGQVIALSDSAAAWVGIGMLFAALLAAPFLIGTYALTLMVSAMIAVIGAVGLNLLTGTTGLISLGQAGFLAVGAYTNAILMTDYHLPVWFSLPAAGITGALISIIVGVPSLRLKGLYLAIITLAFGFIIAHIILYAEGLTHGANGIFITGARLFGFDLQRGPALYYLTLALTVATILAALNLLRTRVGRAWIAIRDHGIAARVMGIDLVRYKLLSFAVSSFMVAIAGALLSLQIRFVNIDVFALILSIEALAMIILGGLGSVAGAVLGAVFLSYLPEAIRLGMAIIVDPASAFYGNYVYEARGIVNGLVIVLFLRFKPDGLIGFWRDARKYWSNWPLAY